MIEWARNVSLRVEDTEQPDTFTVSGRGELHLTILMETMRREGFEFQVSRPRVITRKADDGQLQEPYEEAVVEVVGQAAGMALQTDRAAYVTVDESQLRSAVRSAMGAEVTS